MGDCGVVAEEEGVVDNRGKGVAVIIVLGRRSESGLRKRLGGRCMVMMRMRRKRIRREARRGGGLGCRMGMLHAGDGRAAFCGGGGGGAG